MRKVINQWWPAITYIAITVSCGFIYWLVPAGMFPYVLSFSEAMHFSVVTGTTLGYGDITPTEPFTRIITAAQAFSSPILLAYFVSFTLYQQQLKDQKREKLDEEQKIFSRLYAVLDRFLLDIAAPRSGTVSTIIFKTSSEPLKVKAFYYDAVRSKIAVNNRARLHFEHALPVDGLWLQLRRSRLPTIFKPALLTFSRDLVDYASSASNLPVDVSLTVSSLMRLTGDLESDIGPFMRGMTQEELDGQLQLNWENTNLQALLRVELSVYELMATVESRPCVEVLTE